MRLRGVPGLQRAWTWSTGSASAPVAVLDTGVTAHPELRGTWLPGVDMVSDPAMANDGNGRDDDPSDPGDWISASERAQDTLRHLRIARQLVARHDRQRHARRAHRQPARAWPR